MGSNGHFSPRRSRGCPQGRLRETAHGAAAAALQGHNTVVGTHTREANNWGKDCSGCPGGILTAIMHRAPGYDWTWGTDMGRKTEKSAPRWTDQYLTRALSRLTFTSIISCTQPDPQCRSICRFTTHYHLRHYDDTFWSAAEGTTHTNSAAVAPKTGEGARTM
jgi:hypothetical protein